MAPEVKFRVQFAHRIWPGSRTPRVMLSELAAGEELL